MNNVSFKLNPIEWNNNSPNYVVCITGMVAAANSFSVLNGSIIDSSGATIKNFTFANLSGLNTFGKVLSSTKNENFPWKVSFDINCNASFKQSVTSQHSLGSKENSGMPVCYQVSTFFNDSGSDNDWNDLVLNFQLFDSSTD